MSETPNVDDLNPIKSRLIEWLSRYEGSLTKREAESFSSIVGRLEQWQHRVMARVDRRRAS